MYSVSDFTKQMLVDIVTGSLGQFERILSINELINQLGSELQDPDISFKQKFQFIDDMKFLADYLDIELASFNPDHIQQILESRDEEQKRIFEEMKKYTESDDEQ